MAPNANHPADSSAHSFESMHKPDSGNGWGKGIVKDFKNTVGTYWLKDFTNPNQKTLAVSFFLFFACIAPAITFGAIYAKATNNNIGAVEMILATAWCGILYAFVGGQPMMINGGTGPVLAFSEILFKMSKTIDVPFLAFNAWIGIWVTVYMFIAAIVDLNKVIVYATRFTDEIFSLLIAAIFVINAVGSPFTPIGVLHYFNPNHSSHDIFEVADGGYSYMATALLSLILCIGTVQVSFMLRKLKFSPYFPNQIIRDVITDFSVVISILLFSLIAYFANRFSDVPTEKLNVPDRFAPTFACCTSSCKLNWPEDCPELPEPVTYRPWFVDIFDLNGKNWIPFMAAGPAILAFVLVFLDDGITWHLINHPAHKLKHGHAYNYDTIIVGVMVLVNSFLGLPWLVAATVRSLNHIHAMAEKDQSGKILSIQETRLTHLFIHVLCLIAIFALDALKFIPVPVLYGVFLYMGLLSLGTNQFWGRFTMFFMQPAKYPVEPHTQYTAPRRMHIYTALQVSLFVLLYVVKSIKTISIAFPIVIALCIPFRLYVLPKIFTLEELVMLDSDDDTIKEYFEWKKQTEADKNDIEKEKPEEEDGGEGGGGETYTRVRRIKSPSCPPNMLFAPLSSRAVSVHPRMETRDNTLVSTFAGDLAGVGDGKTTAAQQQMEVSGEDVDAEEANDVVNALPASNLDLNVQQRRRNRKKTLSCPTPHMLFSEAERQISSNYFFG